MGLLGTALDRILLITESLSMLCFCGCRLVVRVYQETADKFVNPEKSHPRIAAAHSRARLVGWEGGSMARGALSWGGGGYDPGGCTQEMKKLRTRVMICIRGRSTSPTNT